MTVPITVASGLTRSLVLAGASTVGLGGDRTRPALGVGRETA